MKIKSLGANQTEVTLNDDTCVLVSYETPVATFIIGKGVIKSTTKHSVTTSRHVNQWVKKDYPNATLTEVSQKTLDALI